MTALKINFTDIFLRSYDLNVPSIFFNVESTLNIGHSRKDK